MKVEHGSNGGSRANITLRMGIFGRQFSIQAVNLTSAASAFIFAMVYGMIEHMLLASPLGIRILVHPLNWHLVGQIYFYHAVMLALALLISFNPFFDVLFFRASRAVRRQALLWGTGNMLQFVWLEDMFYFALFGEWPKDVMTPLHLSFYGVVWWYPVMLGAGAFMYYLSARTASAAAAGGAAAARTRTG